MEDSLDTDFFTLNTMPEQLISQYNIEEASYLVCAVLNDFPDDYWISIDGEKITVPIVNSEGAYSDTASVVPQDVKQ